MTESGARRETGRKGADRALMSVMKIGDKETDRRICIRTKEEMRDEKAVHERAVEIPGKLMTLCGKTDVKIRNGFQPRTFQIEFSTFGYVCSNY